MSFGSSASRGSSTQAIFHGVERLYNYLTDRKRISVDTTYQIPTDFSDLQTAFNAIALFNIDPDVNVTVNIEMGHALTGGLNLRGGDYSHIKITSTDAVVLLDAGFVGADTSGVPAGILGSVSGAPLFFGYGVKMPKISALFDMGNLHGTGYHLAESEGVVDEGCGVKNAGYRGAVIHGRCNLYNAVFSGANGTGLRLQQASNVCARNGNFDNCCKTVDLAASAVYVSRSSILEFRGGSAENSGASGLIARRSIVTADEASFDGAADKGVEAENCAQVSFANGSALNCVSNALRCVAAGNLYAVGASTSTTSSADNLVVDVGGVMTIAGSTTVEGVPATEANIDVYSNLAYVNAFDEAGMIFFDSANGAFKITSNANGISQRFADGRMIAWTGAQTVNTGSVASGSFSGQLTLPTLPDTFVSVDHVALTVVGRGNIDGGGNRVCIDNYHRGLSSGDAWRVKNTGQQLDGASTGLAIQSVNVQMLVHGTWK